jgi:hypothetical protein
MRPRSRPNSRIRSNQARNPVIQRHLDAFIRPRYALIRPRPRRRGRPNNCYTARDRDVGTDIELFVEYDVCEGEPFSGRDRIGSLTRGSFELPRDSPFSAIAGMRGSSPKPVVPPRGIPSFLALETSRSYYNFIVEDSDGPLPPLCDDRYILRSEAVEWVADGGSHYAPQSPDPPRLVSEPAFGVGWLDSAEFARALESANAEHGPISPQFAALGAAVAILAERYGTDRVRVVFWFG